MRKRMTRTMTIAVLGVALGLGGVGESVAQSGMKKDDTMKMDDKKMDDKMKTGDAMKSGDPMKSGDAMKKAGDGMKDDMKKDGKAPMQGDRMMEKKQ